MLLLAPKFGGIKQRYTTTHAGEVHRVLDPIRKCYREFPDQLHYENYLLHFAVPEVTTILIGDAIPRHVKHAVANPRKAQFYRYLDRPSVLHEIVTNGRAPAGERWVAPGVRLAIRTPGDIRACPATLEALGVARRIMSRHVDLPLEPERALVHERLAGRLEFTIGDLAESASAASSEAIDRIVVAILRAVAGGWCTVDWSRGPWSARTRVVRTDKPLPRPKKLFVRNHDDAMVRGAMQSSAGRLQMRRGHGR